MHDRVTNVLAICPPSACFRDEASSSRFLGLLCSCRQVVARTIFPFLLLNHPIIHNLEEDVAATVAALETQYSWLSLGEQGERIRQIVNREEKHDFFSSLRVWHAYLEEHLEVPFVATVVEDQRGPVKQGDEVKVIGISLLDETYGTIVRVRQKRRVYHLPLHDLRATNAPAEIEQLVEDYAVWLVRYPTLFAQYPP